MQTQVTAAVTTYNSNTGGSSHRGSSATLPGLPGVSCLCGSAATAIWTASLFITRVAEVLTGIASNQTYYECSIRKRLHTL